MIVWFVILAVCLIMALILNFAVAILLTILGISRIVKQEGGTDDH